MTHEPKPRVTAEELAAAFDPHAIAEEVRNLNDNARATLGDLLELLIKNIPVENTDPNN